MQDVKAVRLISIQVQMELTGHYWVELLIPVVDMVVGSVVILIAQRSVEQKWF